MSVLHASRCLALTAIALATGGCGATPSANAPATTAVDAAPTTAATPQAAAPVALEKPTDKALILAPRQYAEMRQMLALDERCHWLGAAEKAAIAGSAQERLAWLGVWGDTSQAEAAASTALEQFASIDCSSAKAVELGKAVQHGAWQMRITWALRGAALLGGPGRPAWLGEVGGLDRHRAVLEETATALETKYPDVRNARQAITSETDRVVAVLCPAGQCPAVEHVADAGKLRDYAQAWIKGAQAYADALAQTPDRIGEPAFIRQQ